MIETTQAVQSRPVVVDTDRMSVKVINDLSSLDHLAPAMDELAAVAIEPNPFYESWMLLPALRAFGAGKDLRLVMVVAPNKNSPSGSEVLCGLFPLEKRRSDRLPVKVLTLWKHKFGFLCTPLIRSDCAPESLSAFFDWLEADAAGCSLMEFKRVAGEGPFNRLLVEQLHQRLLLSFATESYTRALFRPASSADEYLSVAMSGMHRKDLRRKKRRLSEAGNFEIEELQPDGLLEQWIEEFLELEMSGWKGETGGALASSEATRTFFTSLAKEAFYRGKLMMLSAKFDGKPIAQKCNLITGNGSFAFKIAYDEDYARYSPGMMLEIENINRLHSRPEIKWMDSCAIPNHPMINRLWPDRRVIQSLLVPTRKGKGEFLVSMMPLARWLNRKVRAVTRKRAESLEEANK